MENNIKLITTVKQLFDFCDAESLTHHLNKATADMVKVDEFESDIERSNAIFKNSQLINFINKLNTIVKDKPTLPPLNQTQLN